MEYYGLQVFSQLTHFFILRRTPTKGVIYDYYIMMGAENIYLALFEKISTAIFSFKVYRYIYIKMIDILQNEVALKNQQSLRKIFRKTLAKQGMSLGVLSALSGVSLARLWKAEEEGLHKIPLKDLYYILDALNLDSNELLPFLGANLKPHFNIESANLRSWYFCLFFFHLTHLYWCPHQDSNLESHFRKMELYPV